VDQASIYNQLLVLRCQEGQEDAWEELVSRWERPLLYYIRRMVDNESEAWQVLQETWLHAVKNLHRLNAPQCFPKWLYSICRREVIAYYRTHHREIEFYDQVSQAGYAGEPESDHQFENAEAVHWGLAQMKPGFREVLTLFFLQDLSIDEIADVLSVPAGTVKSRLYYARRQLRAILEGDKNDCFK
jgi:RNA polymerase sigma factor (sigma-70 family)